MSKSECPAFSHTELLSILSYDPEVGVFYWSKRIGCATPGMPAGSWNTSAERLYIMIGKRRYLAHRLAWFYIHGVWPNKNIICTNGNYADLRRNNLAEETHAQTAARKRGGYGFSGIKGISWDKCRKRWSADICRGYKRRRIGEYRTKEEAKLAYDQAVKSDTEAPASS